MNTVPKPTQKRIRLLRKTGLSHRHIATSLKLGLGTVFNYAREIKLTETQRSLLKLKAYKNGLGQLSKSELKAAAIKGGFNTPSKFKQIIS